MYLCICLCLPASPMEKYEIKSISACHCVCVHLRVCEFEIVTLLAFSPPFVLPEADQAKGK